MELVLVATTQCTSELVARVVAEIGHHICAIGNATQQLTRTGRDRPAGLVTVGCGDDAPGARSSHRGREQSERRRRAEPHRGTAMLLHECDRASADTGGGK